MLTQFVLCVVNERFFSSAHELLSACVLAVFFFFYVFLCICVLVLYLLVVRAASTDGCLCLSGSLPLLSVCLCLLCFEANKYDDDDDHTNRICTRVAAPNMNKLSAYKAYSATIAL